MKRIIFFAIVFFLLVFSAKSVQATFVPDSTSWRSGDLNGRPVFRTNFATDEGPTTGSAASPPFGLYDPVSNKTFMVYAGGLRSDGIHSAQDPFVVSFDHTTHTWQSPVRVAQTQYLGTDGIAGDDHNYGQISLDNQGYLHVFQTFHAGGQDAVRDVNVLRGVDILQATSKSARSIGASPTDWQISSIPNTCHNTYGASFTDNQGELYVFFRTSEGLNPSIDRKTAFDPAVYEPEAFVKSSDSGHTWTPRTIAINPGRHPSCTECAKNTDGSYLNNFCQPSETRCCSTGIVHNTLGPNQPGPTTIYASHFVQDKVKNGVWMSFAPLTGHGGYTLTNPWPTPKYAAFFSFDNDHFYSLYGDDLGTSIDYNEYTSGNCCTVDPEINGGGQPLLPVIEDQVSRQPTFYYTISPPSDPVNGHPKRSFQAKWDSTSHTWVRTELTSVFGDINGFIAGDYNSQTGTSLYTRRYDTGLPPFNQCNPPVSASLNYQWPLTVFNNKNGWQQLRIFNASETDSSGTTADHRSWEVRGPSRVSVIPDAHPEMKTMIVIPKYTCAKPYWQSGGPQYFWRIFPLGAYYILGDEPLVGINGDLNNDNFVNATDLPLFLSAFSSNASTADLTGDSAINLFDYNVFVTNFE